MKIATSPYSHTIQVAKVISFNMVLTLIVEEAVREWGPPVRVGGRRYPAEPAKALAAPIAALAQRA